MPMMFQIKAQLQGVSKPPVWRRLLIPTRTTFYELHLILQEAIPWMDYHQHRFETKISIIIDNGSFDSIYLEDLLSPDQLLLFDRDTLVFQTLLAGVPIHYYYDFGDGWRWKIKLEKILEHDGPGLPELLAWKGTAPPEDVGGTDGFAHFKEVMADPSSQEYQSMKDWAESQGYGDPDVKIINETLGSIFQYPEYIQCRSPYVWDEEEED